MIRLAIVSTGYMANTHAKEFNKIEGRSDENTEHIQGIQGNFFIRKK